MVQQPTANCPQPIWPAFAQGLLIACAGLVLIARCWDAPFLSYDDTAHVHDVPQVFGKAPLADLFKTPGDTYRPITFLSYRLDYELAGRRLEAAGDQNWAFAIRIGTWIYHSVAAIILWRLLLTIGLSPGAALFVCLAFAVHPTCCETVCWVSERKSALAAMFGFGALLAYLSIEKLAWRAVICVLLYMLSLFSKPSSLGLLPLFPLITLFGGAAGLRGERGLNLRPNTSWKTAGLCILPLVAVALFDLRMNLIGHAATIVAPPGGSVFTAVLTDIPILVRYVFATLAPVNLSIAYYVEPVVSLFSLRLLVGTFALAAIVIATIWIAQNRRRAVFGWLWFFVALAPSMNIIAIFYLMQDRYIYLSLPGILLAFTEAAQGLQSRARDITPTLLRAVGAVLILSLATIAFLRGDDFRSSLKLFADAVNKQPQSSWARYGLMEAYLQEGFEQSKYSRQKQEEYRALAEEQRRLFLDDCPDAQRQFLYTLMAVEAGEYRFGLNQMADAERYFKLAAFPAPGVQNTLQTQAKALRGLALVHLHTHSPGRNAYALAQAALETGDSPDQSRLIRAKAAIAWAIEESDKGAADKSDKLRAQARMDLESIADGSAYFEQARKALKDAGLAAAK